MRSIILSTILNSAILLGLWCMLVGAMENTYDFYRVASVVASMIWEVYPLETGIILSLFISLLTSLINYIIIKKMR